jgi:zinc transporter, ZIP family
MAAAFGWGTLAASSLVIGALVALWFRISLRVIGLIMGFGAGVLISAVAFDLVQEATEKSSGSGWAIAGIFAGCLVFFGGDWPRSATRPTATTPAARSRCSRATTA